MGGSRAPIVGRMSQPADEYMGIRREQIESMSGESFPGLP